MTMTHVRLVHSNNEHGRTGYILQLLYPNKFYKMYTALWFFFKILVVHLHPLFLFLWFMVGGDWKMLN